MKRIVFTGGPSSGKTTIMRKLLDHFGHKILLVPETATLLLQGGYPGPGKLMPWSEEWHLLFEDAVFNLQKSIERASLLMAMHNDSEIIFFDRGILDVAGHLPGGVAQFCQRYKTTEKESLLQYDIVIHLVSYAMFDPRGYQEIAESRWGKSYFSSVEYARHIEEATLSVWANHKKRFIVDGHGNIEQKATEVIEIIERVKA